MNASNRIFVTVPLLVLLVASHGAAAPVPKPQACSITKIKATTRAFSCMLGEQFRLLRGSSADFARCSDKLASTFGKAELRAEGQCWTSGDDDDARSQIEEAAAGVFDALQASLVTDGDSLRCLQKQLKVVKRFASCMTDALSARATGVYAGDGGDFQFCTYRLSTGSTAVEEAYDCVAPAPIDELVFWTGGGYAYLPSYVAPGDSTADYHRAIVPNGNLSASDFTGVSMTRMDARSADFSGAALVDTSWNLSNLTGADFSGADLTGSEAWKANLALAELGTATLEESCWRELEGGVCPATLPAGWICRSGWLLGATMDCTLGPYGDPVTGMDFSALDLSMSSFPDAAFVEGTFAGSDLSSANLENSRFTGTNLSGCDLSNANMGGIEMEGVNLTGVDMSSADLDNGRSIRFASITGCPTLPIGMACLSGTILGPYANLREADLSGLDLSGIDLTGSFLVYANLSGATLGATSLSRSSFYGADLTGVDMSAVNLNYSRNGNLVACPVAAPPAWRCVANALLGPTVDLIQTDLSAQDLSGLDLFDANIWGCNLTGANLAGANLASVDWMGSTCPDGTAAGTDGGTCCGHHVGMPPAVCN